VLPTRYDNEGQPVCIIEAMHSGTVVVATDYRAIPDMVQHHVTGYLVSRAEPESIAQCIVDAIRHPERYTEMSGAAIDHFTRHFTREAHLNRLVPLVTGAGG
jgi:glycosyltransferase involved in cell wall biosynthesis